MESINDLRDLVLELSGQLNRLHKQLSFLEVENRELRWKSHQKDLRIHQLEEDLSKYKRPKKNSRNSSIAPSQEPISEQALRRTQSLRVSSGLKPGGQAGHRGHHLSLPDQVDREEIHSVSICPQCGGDLSGIEEELQETSYPIDLPQISPEVIRHQLMGRRCPCGCMSKGRFPGHLRGYLSYGRGVQTTVGYLHTVHHLPMKRTAKLMKELFGIPLSSGTVHRLVQGMHTSGLPVYAHIREQISQSQVVGADETGMKINGKSHWFWTFQTDKLTYVFPHESRGKAAVDDHFPKGLPGSWIVTDRHSSYFNLFVKGHQICLPHVLRNLQYLSELDPSQTWSQRLKGLLQEAIHQRKTLPWHRIDGVKMINRLNDLLGEDVSHFHPDIQSLQTGLIKHREHMLNFLFYDFLPSDNNASERSIRPVKVKQKVSGGFRTDNGAMAYAVLHSITDTAKKSDRSPWKELWGLTSG